MSSKLGRRARERMNATDPNRLPQTYEEYVAQVRPHVLADIERMARLCQEAGIPGTYTNLEEVPYFDRSAALMREIENQADQCASDWRRMGMTRQDYVLGTAARPEVLKELLYYVETDTAQLLRFRLAGKPIFRISPGLAQRLADTRMNVPTERMRLPFPTLMLSFDDDTTSDALGRLQKDGVIRESRAINVMVHEFNDKRGRRWSFTALRTHGKRSHFMAMRSIALDQGGDADTALRTDWIEREGERDENPLLKAAMGGKPIVDAIHYQEGLDFYRIVINAVLYITSHKPSLTSHTRCASDGPAKRHNLEYVVAGEGMTLINDMQASERAPSKGSSRVPTKLHRVKGHWKDQRCGPAGSDRMHIFVDPYMRGADADTLISKPYDVR